MKPKARRQYAELDLKLGIKSSLPHIKSTLAMSMLLWEGSGRAAQLVYANQENDKLVITEESLNGLLALAQDAGINGITEETLRDVASNNQLFKSQLESLIVAYELVWKLAQVRFVDFASTTNERTGNVRYPKRISFSTNADIFHILIQSKWTEYIRVLFNWIGINVATDPECEKNLIALFTAFSEGAVFKLREGTNDILFHQLGIYEELLTGANSVNIEDEHEAKGPLRILNSILRDNFHAYLTGSASAVRINDDQRESLSEYQKRVEVFLQLSATKVVGTEELDDDTQDDAPATDDTQENAHVVMEPVSNGENVLLYGVPGVGKSWTIQTEYCNDEHFIERVVFHPDYTYSDFVGQILPRSENGNVRYEFQPGPFTKLLKKAKDHPDHAYYLVIEEINRGNAPAIFGDVFQLLDRTTEETEYGPAGTSQYGITNEDVALVVYGDPEAFVRIPSNMSILATMNTADQNVFTLDTAFQRRWHMRMIENSFDGHAYADDRILDTSITWRNFCLAMNHEILQKSAGITSSEDKRLGAYFVSKEALQYHAEDEGSETDKKRARRHNSQFAEKVIKYLWDDAFKYSRSDIFETSNYASLEEIVRQFMEKTGDERLLVFKEEIRNLMKNPVQ